MISKKIEKALNGQIREEAYSAYLYLSMSAYFETLNLKGFAQWMRIQAQEELTHVQKFYDYLIGRQGHVILQKIDAPPSNWDSPLAAFTDAYNHECHITGCINELVQLAVKEKDRATESMLQWFVDEQVEEEASVDDVVQRLKLVGTDGTGLYMVDRELAQRVFVPAADGGEGA